MANLTCFPVPCPCGEHAHPADLPHRMAHSKSKRCPFVTAEYQFEVERGTCCTIDGQDLEQSLLFWEESELSAQVREPKPTCKDAGAFGRALEWAYEYAMNENPDLDETNEKDREALIHAETIGVAGSWYQDVAAQGFGIATEFES